MSFAYMTASELKGLLAARDISPVELVEDTLSRQEALEPKINAFVTRTPEVALEAAREAERAIAAGEAGASRASPPRSRTWWRWRACPGPSAPAPSRTTWWISTRRRWSGSGRPAAALSASPPPASSAARRSATAPSPGSPATRGTWRRHPAAPAAAVPRASPPGSRPSRSAPMAAALCEFRLRSAGSSASRGSSRGCRCTRSRRRRPSPTWARSRGRCGTPRCCSASWRATTAAMPSASPSPCRISLRRAMAARRGCASPGAPPWATPSPSPRSSRSARLPPNASRRWGVRSSWSKTRSAKTRSRSGWRSSTAASAPSWRA